MGSPLKGRICSAQEQILSFCSKRALKLCEGWPCHHWLAQEGSCLLTLAMLNKLPCPLLIFSQSYLAFGRKVLAPLNPCHPEQIKMPCPHLIFSQSYYLIQVVDTNSHTQWQTEQIQISWLQKPTGLDLHCLQRQGISRFSRTRVEASSWVGALFTSIPFFLPVSLSWGEGLTWLKYSWQGHWTPTHINKSLQCRLLSKRVNYFSEEANWSGSTLFAKAGYMELTT